MAAPTRQRRRASRAVTAYPGFRSVLPWVLAVAVVAIIIIVIRLVDTPTNSGSLTPTTVAHTHQAKTERAPLAVPGASQLSTFAKSMNEANLAASQVLDKTGGTITLAQLDAVVFPYTTAVKVYAYQLHFVVWPTTAATAVQNEYNQLTALLSFMGTIGTVNLNTLRVWEAQFHSACADTQGVDNVLRQNVGLAPSYTFP
jgi:hypothetical protein